jgi:hypothetical protein
MHNHAEGTQEAVVEEFFFVEGLLRESLQFIPFCKEHLAVWSPRFTTIILEASSQTDSLWKKAADKNKIRRVKAPTSKNKPKKPARDADLRITDYFEHFGIVLFPQWALLFNSSERTIINPFEAWNDSGRRSVKYRPLPWWSAYNALKHDRLGNRSLATLDNAVQAVAALFLSVIYSGLCDQAILDNELLQIHMHSATFALIKDLSPMNWAKIESKLFAHPIGWCDKKVRQGSWWPTEGQRFRSHWRAYSQEGADPHATRAK